MTEKWRGIFELFGLTMLAASVVFVAFQMQQDRKIALAELNTSQLEMFASRLNAGLESEPYLAMYEKLYATKAWDTKGLSTLEIAAAEIDAQIWLTYLEMAYEHYREGMVDEMGWVELQGEIKYYLSVPAYRAVYDVLWQQAPSEFTRAVDEIIAGIVPGQASLPIAD
jgi:hypothetical protein